jgi:hypothetical protein
MSTPIGEGYEAERTAKPMIAPGIEMLARFAGDMERNGITPQMVVDYFERETTSSRVNKLRLSGLASGCIWTMEDGPESHPIGIRLDCGKSGTVYLSREQAAELAEQLQSYL